MTKDQTWVSVRIDRQTLDALKAAAKQESRSVSKQILHYVLRGLNEKKSPGAVRLDRGLNGGDNVKGDRIARNKA